MNKKVIIIGVSITAILAVLAAVLLNAYYEPYVYKRRVREAMNFLAKIKQRQESYRNEFGQYANVSETLDDTNPAGPPGINPVGWTSTNKWDQLGASPDGPIRFRYSTIAGFPGTEYVGINHSNHWFIARAIGNLEGDRETLTLEVSSQSARIFNSGNISHTY